MAKGDPCSKCGRPSVTRDGRFCLKCLRAWLDEDTPLVWYRSRSADQRQAREFEPSPWQENAIRFLEDG